MPRSPCGNAKTHDLPSIFGIPAHQELVIRVLALETIPQRFGIDSEHTGSIAQNPRFFT